jgi:hypothetical protein
MKSSILFYRDRGDTLNVVDSDALSHTDDISPIMLIAATVMRAGYDGVVIDQYRMANGRYFQALNTNSATPEGRVLAALCKLDPAQLPPSQDVLEMIRRAYQNGGGAV